MRTMPVVSTLRVATRRLSCDQSKAVMLSAVKSVGWTHHLEGGAGVRDLSASGRTER